MKSCAGADWRRRGRGRGRRILGRPVVHQHTLNLRRKAGLTDSASATEAADVDNFFRVECTQGIAGAAATPVQANPNAGNANNIQFPNWAHPLDYGAAVGTPNARSERDVLLLSLRHERKLGYRLPR